MKKKTKKNLKYLFRLFWIFVIGSIVGFIYENILVFCQKGTFILRQGLLYGPFIPIYGIGAVVYEMVVPKMRNAVQVFFYTMFLGGVVEYIGSYLQEVLFGTISWDYHWVTINFNGRTSMLHAFYWGVAGVIYYLIINPWFDKIIVSNITQKVMIITAFVVVIITSDVLLSWVAMVRQKERILEKPPATAIDRFLDKYYPDEKIDKIYTNKIVKVEKCL